MDYIQSLTNYLTKLPGVGKKTAQRYAYYILNQEDDYAMKLSNAIKDVKNNITYCGICHNLTSIDPCEICSSNSRDKSIICVVGEPKDVATIERTKEYRGLYHVLGGLLSPLDAIGPEDIKIRELLLRLRSDEVKEIILATNLTVEGETTATYLARIIKPLGVSVTRIAKGIPTGADLEYTDEVTLANALMQRRDV